ncbi:MAG: homoserine dehydrogenase [Clostridia bacterium]
MKSIRVGMMGLGTVGGGVASMLSENGVLIDKKAGSRIVLEKILVRDINKARKDVPLNIKNLLTGNPADILENPGIDIVVEVMGGTDEALEFVRTALRNKKHVVTANKDMMAAYGGDLFAEADKSGSALLFEASVCAAIPVVDVLKHSLAGNRISRIMGILNGTTNYILTKMSEEKSEYSQALKKAMDRGYAESNPVNDVMGYDAARKIAILASIAFSMRVKYEDVFTEGITGISLCDIDYAAELGYRIKLIADAKFSDKGVEARVNPLFIPTGHPLSNVDGVFNAVYIESDMAGETMLYGKGAGAKPTASAVLGDIIALARAINSGGTVFTGCTCFNEKMIVSPENAVSRFYIRMNVKDNPGVLSRIAGVLGDHDVSIYSVVQKKAQLQSAEIVIITHMVMEKNMLDSITEIRGMDIVNEFGSLIRVEGED